MLILLLPLSLLHAGSISLTASAAAGAAQAWYFNTDDSRQTSLTADLSFGVKYKSEKIRLSGYLTVIHNSDSMMHGRTYFLGSNMAGPGFAVGFPVTKTLDAQLDAVLAFGSYHSSRILIFSPSVSLSLVFSPCEYISLFPRLTLAYSQSDLALRFSVGCTISTASMQW